jgi:hypothetical protein
MLYESQCSAYRIETNMDYVGGDLLNEAATVRDQNGCCAACERATRCNAFTYVVETQACWLKTGRRHAQPATADERGATIVSGVRGRLKARPRLASFDGVFHLETGGMSVQGPLDSTRVQTPRSGGAVLYAARLALQQERSAQEQQAVQLIERARSRWQGTLFDVDGHPLVRLSVAPLTNVSLRGTATAWLSRTGKGAAATTWLHWPLLRQPHPAAASSAVALAVGTFRPRSSTPSWRWLPLVLRAPMREHQPDTRAAAIADEAGAAAAPGTAPDAAAEEEPEQVSEGAIGGDGGAAQDDAQVDGSHTSALRTSPFEVGAALPDVAPSLSGGHRMLVRLSARHDASSHWVHYRTIELGLGTKALGTASAGLASATSTSTSAVSEAAPAPSSVSALVAGGLHASAHHGAPAPSSVSALVAGGLHASAHHGARHLENALLAEALGFRVPLLLTTSAPCAASTQSPATSLSSSADESVRAAADGAMGEERGPLSARGRREGLCGEMGLSLEERCLHCLAPLLRAVALMPAAGRDEHTRERRCGRDWAARWRPGPPGATMYDPVASDSSAASISSISSASSASSTTSCDPNAPHTPPPMVLFARGPVAFMALSAALSLRAHSSARRTAVAARAAGADWVVAYGEAADGSIGGPSGEGNGHVREEEVRGLADVLLYSTNAANATSRAVVHSTALGGTLLILRSDEYARLHANRTAMAIERVRAADGCVLETLAFRKRRSSCCT